LPLNIAFLIDSSGSIRDKLRFERQAAAKFFSSTLRPGKDKALVISFDSKAALLQDYTDNPTPDFQKRRRRSFLGAPPLYMTPYLKASVHRWRSNREDESSSFSATAWINSSHISLSKTLEGRRRAM